MLLAGAPGIRRGSPAFRPRIHLRLFSSPLCVPEPCPPAAVRPAARFRPTREPRFAPQARSSEASSAWSSNTSEMRAPIVFMCPRRTSRGWARRLSSTSTARTPESMVALSGMNPAAEARGILIPYPQGLLANGLPVFDAGLRDFSAAPRDDVDFARAIADGVASRYCLDRRRVYSTGFSNGARMSYRIACEAADLVAAIAPVAGVLSLDPGECNPTRPVPALAFHGTADVVAPYDRAGGFSTRSVPSMFEVWAEKAEGTGESSLTENSELLSCEAYQDCVAALNRSCARLRTAATAGRADPAAGLLMSRSRSRPPKPCSISSNGSRWRAETLPARRIVRRQFVLTWIPPGSPRSATGGSPPSATIRALASW